MADGSATPRGLPWRLPRPRLTRPPFAAHAHEVLGKRVFGGGGRTITRLAAGESFGTRMSGAAGDVGQPRRSRKCHEFETDLGDIAVRQPGTRRSYKINMSCDVRPYSCRFSVLVAFSRRS